MTESTSELARHFTFNRRTLSMIVEALDDEDWSRAPSPNGGNTAHWILGHVVTSRRSLIRKLGGDLFEEPWEEHFRMHAKPTGTEGYPAPDALLQELGRADELLSRELDALTDERAKEKWGSDFPDGSSTLAGGAHFLYFHETYHVGQLGLLRRIVGKPGFV